MKYTKSKQKTLKYPNKTQECCPKTTKLRREKYQTRTEEDPQKKKVKSTPKKTKTRLEECLVS